MADPGHGFEGVKAAGASIRRMVYCAAAGEGAAAGAPVARREFPKRVNGIAVEFGNRGIRSHPPVHGGRASRKRPPTVWAGTRRL